MRSRAPAAPPDPYVQTARAAGLAAVASQPNARRDAQERAVLAYIRRCAAVAPNPRGR